MNLTEFSKNIPPEQLAHIFKDFFEHHIAAYYMLQGVNFVKINKVDVNRASIMYSVKVLEDQDKTRLVDNIMRHGSYINIYGRTIKPEVFLNGDLLCITISK